MVYDSISLYLFLFYYVCACLVVGFQGLFDSEGVAIKLVWQV